MAARWIKTRDHKPSPHNPNYADMLMAIDGQPAMAASEMLSALHPRAGSAECKTKVPRRSSTNSTVFIAVLGLKEPH